MERQVIKTTVVTDKYVAHVTVVDFDQDKHQEIFNSKLAELLIKSQIHKTG